MADNTQSAPSPANRSSLPTKSIAPASAESDKLLAQSIEFGRSRERLLNNQACIASLDDPRAQLHAPIQQLLLDSVKRFSRRIFGGYQLAVHKLEIYMLAICYIGKDLTAHHHGGSLAGRWPQCGK